MKKYQNFGSFVEWVEEESFFLNFQSGKILFFYTENPNFILPESRRNEVISFERFKRFVSK